MKKILVLLIIFSGLGADSQVSISTNLLRTIPLERPLSFEVRISRPTSVSFSKFQLQLDSGIVVQEIDSKGGTFSFEENKVKIVWVTAPQETEFIIRLKILPLSTPKKSFFFIKYYFMEHEVKKEVECKPFLVTFKDTVMPVFFSAPMNLISPPVLVINTETPVAKSTLKGQEQIDLQVRQLKKDSRDAYEVGKREKQKAENKLLRISEDEKKLPAITDPDERIVAEQKLNEERKKANEELLVAQRVLTLSKSLEANANDIERINTSNSKKMNSGKGATAEASTISSAASENTSKQPASVKLSSASGMVYRVQIGAFKERPSVGDFKKFGKVAVVKENNTFKLLVGNYDSRSDAVKMRDQLSAQFAGCFIVVYRNGIKAE